MSKEYMIPISGTVNRLIESYLNYVSLEYNHLEYHHQMLKIVNDITPKLMQTYLESIKSFNTFSFLA